MTRCLQLQQGVSAPNRTRSTQFLRPKVVPLALPEHRFAERTPAFRRARARDGMSEPAGGGISSVFPLYVTGAMRFANDVML